MRLRTDDYPSGLQKIACLWRSRCGILGKMLYRISFETPGKAVLFSAELSDLERERLEKTLSGLQGRGKIQHGWMIEREAPATYHDLYEWFDKEDFFKNGEEEGSDWPYSWPRPT